MKGLIESMLQYDEDKRIGWTELIDNRFLRSRISVIYTDLQVQVQVQPNQQSQPNYELFVTCIGPELVDEDTAEDSVVAQSNSPSPQ
jgi:hypothetical protein